METLLMIVTIVALALALGMSVLAWRMLRENRLRSAARVEALQALAADDRFATLDEDPDEVLEPQHLRTSAPRNLEAWDLKFAETAPKPQASSLKPSPELVFAATVTAPAGPPKRRWLALAVVGVLMAVAGSAVYTLYGPAIAAESGEALTRIRSGAARPLELLSLRHSNDADGTFAVTGLIQNPADGISVRNVIAMVYLFDRDGNYFASAKAAIDFTVLHPGDESPFVVRVPNVTGVSRYRVGFRLEEGGIVAHVDRRGQLPGGTTGDSIESSSVPRSSAARGSDRP